jgi:hypothetical protein
MGWLNWNVVERGGNGTIGHDYRPASQRIRPVLQSSFSPENLIAGKRERDW